jgi:NTP pyrophosphatase (non-canonical NTP hydrolase)
VKIAFAQQVRSAVSPAATPRKVAVVPDSTNALSLQDFQELIRRMYLEKDVARGVDGTFMWLMEEVGELAAALREGTREEQAAEFADVLAWMTTIANVVGVDLAEAVRTKYGAGCPGCGQFVCKCDSAGKP